MQVLESKIARDSVVPQTKLQRHRSLDLGLTAVLLPLSAFASSLAQGALEALQNRTHKVTTLLTLDAAPLDTLLLAYVLGSIALSGLVL